MQSMSISCNGLGCKGTLDCDNCRQTHGCNVTVTCDLCGNEIYEDYYEIEGDEICEDCLAEHYKRSVDNLC